jgi:pentatricopeptide repeat protein
LEKIIANKWCVMAALALACIAAYATALGNGFVCDDLETVSRNPEIRSLRKIPGLLTSEYRNRPGERGGLYRGLVMATFAIDHAVYGGLKPWGFHLTSILFHLVCCVAVWLLLRKLLNNPAAAALGAMMFCVHPIHTEAVTGISNRSDVLMTAFFVLGLLFFMRSVDADANGGQRGSWASYAVALVCFGLSLLSKESAATLPAICFVCVLVSSRLRGALRKPLLVRYAGFALVLAGYAVFRIAVTGAAGSGENGLAGASVTTKFITMTVVLADYLRLMLFPLWQSAGCVFSFNRDSWHTTATDASFLISLPVILGVLAATAFAWRRHPVAAFCALWVFVTLIPVSHVVPIGVVKGERLLYLPSVGFCALAGMAFAALLRAFSGELKTLHLKTVVRVSVFAVVACLAALTARRNLDWRGEFGFYTDIVRKQPDNPFGYYARSWCYGEYMGNLRKEILNATMALELKPDYVNALGRRGNAYTKAGMFEPAAQDMAKFVGLSPGNFQAHNNLGFLFGRLGRYDEAVRQYTLALELRRDSAIAYGNRASAFQKMGRHERAISDYEVFLRMSPNDTWALGRMAECCCETGRFVEAAGAVRRMEALGMPPDEGLKKRITDGLSTPEGQK